MIRLDTASDISEFPRMLVAILYGMANNVVIRVAVLILINCHRCLFCFAWCSIRCWSLPFRGQADCTAVMVSVENFSAVFLWKKCLVVNHFDWVR